MREVNIALIGLGTVGSGVYKTICLQKQRVEHKEGISLNLKKVLALEYAIDIPDSLKATDFYADIVSDKSIDIVIELIGGISPAKEFILAALGAGKTVVTANKDLLAQHWPELNAAAKASGAGLYFEASVGGGIPIIRTIWESLQANEITSMMGIINGTTNYILTKMAEEKLSYEEVLAQAQAQGLAEANPKSDVEGYDAMYKLSILSSLAFHARVPVEYIYREGITGITLEDIKYGQELGYTLKLLAISKREGNTVQARVHPTMIPNTHPLASIRGAFNAIYLHGNIVDDIMLYGRGAGDMPTASAVMSDVIYAANQASHKYTTFYNEKDASSEMTFEKNWESAFFLRLIVLDAPNVLAKIAGIFGSHGVSLASVMQKEHGSESVPLVLITHKAKELSVKQALGELSKIKEVTSVANAIRVES
ncbi:MAG: homoserine dehydrogenase [Clostridia bacterium]|jgi:homoserine dehydrogenase|nr:homoserine dehydrogenase [Clostridia bacterium]MBT7121818.1 homoserine dehydrogenase [Clostridia bacterium]